MAGPAELGSCERQRDGDMLQTLIIGRMAIVRGWGLVVESISSHSANQTFRLPLEGAAEVLDLAPKGCQGARQHALA